MSYSGNNGSSSPKRRRPAENNGNNEPPAKRQRSSKGEQSEEEKLYAVHVAQIEIIGFDPYNDIWFENYKNTVNNLFSNYLYSFSTENTIEKNNTINNDTKSKIETVIQIIGADKFPKYNKILGGENGLYFNIFKMTKTNFNRNIENMIKFSNYESYNNNNNGFLQDIEEPEQPIKEPKQHNISLFYPVVFIFELDKLLKYIIDVGTKNGINPIQLFYWN